jgi:hypothetical protein
MQSLQEDIGSVSQGMRSQQQVRADATTLCAANLFETMHHRDNIELNNAQRLLQQGKRGGGVPSLYA